MTHALFLFDDREASGGFDDLALLGTLEQCQEKAEQGVRRASATQGHIVDIAALKIVLRFWATSEQHPLTGHPPIVSIAWEVV